MAKVKSCLFTFPIARLPDGLLVNSGELRSDRSSMPSAITLKRHPCAIMVFLIHERLSTVQARSTTVLPASHPKYIINAHLFPSLDLLLQLLPPPPIQRTPSRVPTTPLRLGTPAASPESVAGTGQAVDLDPDLKDDQSCRRSDKV